MGSSKKLTLPTPPTQATNPLQQGDMASQSQLGHDLTSGNLPSWLQSTINPNNSANALSQAQGILQPQFRDTLQQITNSAAGAGQLESSTFTDALARSQSDLNSQYQSIVSGQAINDSNQANQNKLGLFGAGLNTLQQGLGNQQQGINQSNSFNLQNYDNLVANAIQNNQNANKQNGWQQLGAVAAPLAGGAAGMFLGGPMGAAVGSQLGSSLYGGFSGQGNTGSQSGNMQNLLAPFMGGGGGGFSGLSSGMGASSGLQGALGPQGNAFAQFLKF